MSLLTVVLGVVGVKTAVDLVLLGVRQITKRTKTPKDDAALEWVKRNEGVIVEYAEKVLGMSKPAPAAKAPAREQKRDHRGN